MNNFGTGLIGFAVLVCLLLVLYSPVLFRHIRIHQISLRLLLGRYLARALQLKLSLSTLFLLIALAAVLFGWAADRTRQDLKYAELEGRIESVGKGAFYVAVAGEARRLSAESKGSAAEVANANRCNLLHKLFWLYRHEREVDQYCDELMKGWSATRLAGRLLAELSCDTSEEFMTLFDENFWGIGLIHDGFDVDLFPYEYRDKSTERYAALKEFIETAL